jgi:hypothetical protein
LKGPRLSLTLHQEGIRATSTAKSFPCNETSPTGRGTKTVFQVISFLF